MWDNWRNAQPLFLSLSLSLYSTYCCFLHQPHSSLLHTHAQFSLTSVTSPFYKVPLRPFLNRDDKVLFLFFFFLIKSNMEMTQAKFKTPGQEGSANWNRCFSGRRQSGRVRRARGRGWDPERESKMQRMQTVTNISAYVSILSSLIRGAAAAGCHRSCPEIIHHPPFLPTSLCLSLIPSRPATK